MSSRVSLDLLHTFLAVHRAGTLTRAAEVLGLSQPTVTAQLRTLETQLGQALFVRGARGVTPTPAADDLARRLDGPLDALAGVAGSLGSEPDRTLLLGGPAELMTERVLPALAGTIGGGVSVRVRLGLADDLLADLSAGQLDLVVSAVRPRRAGLHAEPLCDEEFVLVGTSDVSDKPLLSYAEDMPIIRRWWRHVLGSPPPKRAVLVVPDLRALRAAALAGIGVTVLPRYLIADDLKNGSLRDLHPTDDPPINTLYLATRAAVKDAPHVASARRALLTAARTW
ncbi:LysR family transcriptional regulator [Actinoplanes sp. OR16]|uniref:LysR family transcriptional regulator n=1 Tax=Actinoplanes sp. OR16 TaxID=946334 RepID=UPI000F6F0839|nr:LysR family transcriptional regulator [Actinoplanes sp. OR16]BBH68872.1 LysR family transcriptional regulator [Actinoplanes sp. OR16]